MYDVFELRLTWWGLWIHYFHPKWLWHYWLTCVLDFCFQEGFPCWGSEWTGLLSTGILYTRTCVNDRMEPMRTQFTCLFTRKKHLTSCFKWCQIEYWHPAYFSQCLLYIMSRKCFISTGENKNKKSINLNKK